MDTAHCRQEPNVAGEAFSGAAGRAMTDRLVYEFRHSARVKAALLSREGFPARPLSVSSSDADHVQLQGRSLHLTLTCSDNARTRAAQAMLDGTVDRVVVSGIAVYRDTDVDGTGPYIIWGVDAYGQDRVASTGTTRGIELYAAAVAWAFAEAATTSHPAELSW